MRLMATPAAARLASWASAVPALRRAAYDVAGLQWTTRHEIHRPLRELPLSSYRCYAGMNRQVYETMAGPSEFFGTGTLKDWDVTNRLDEIELPVLITSGAYDEVTPRQCRLLHDRIAGSRWEVFDHSAHCAVIEEPDAYRAVLQEFLATARSSCSTRAGTTSNRTPLCDRRPLVLGTRVSDLSVKGVVLCNKDAPMRSGRRHARRRLSGSRSVRAARNRRGSYGKLGVRREWETRVEVWVRPAQSGDSLFIVRATNRASVLVGNPARRGDEMQRNLGTRSPQRRSSRCPQSRPPRKPESRPATRPDRSQTMCSGPSTCDTHAAARARMLEGAASARRWTEPPLQSQSPPSLRGPRARRSTGLSTPASARAPASALRSSAKPARSRSGTGAKHDPLTAGQSMARGRETMQRAAIDGSSWSTRSAVAATRSC